MTLKRVGLSSTTTAAKTAFASLSEQEEGGSIRTYRLPSRRICGNTHDSATRITAACPSSSIQRMSMYVAARDTPNDCSMAVSSIFRNVSGSVTGGAIESRI